MYSVIHCFCCGDKLIIKGKFRDQLCKDCEVWVNKNNK